MKIFKQWRSYQNRGPKEKKDVEVAKAKFKGQHERFSLKTEGTNRKILNNNFFLHTTSPISR